MCRRAVAAVVAAEPGVGLEGAYDRRKRGRALRMGVRQ
jgi:hypothetical protein